jgi:hypothetical protein
VIRPSCRRNKEQEKRKSNEEAELIRTEEVLDWSACCAHSAALAITVSILAIVRHRLPLAGVFVNRPER